ncbi:MAG: aminotransferase class I/II-fold pyridoxal phosphate-dependent enzyme [Pseudolabrys sp.]|nr:aminotransferase class I/II-fold pyridoxal phosphate-dependent enzyme [Pseudolabrys sp.]
MANSKGSSQLASSQIEPKVTDDNAVVFRGDGEPKTIRRIISQLEALEDTEAVALDVFGLGGIVEKLEKRFASILGKESAVFMPTGTLANHLALRQLCGSKPRAIVQEQSHQYHDTGDCAVQLSGITLVPLAHQRAYFTREELQQTFDAAVIDRVERPVGAVMVETPVRRRHGLIVPYDVMASITDLCRTRGIPVHLDAARLYMMSSVTGISPQRYAALFDTVYVSLYKYFGAPFGGILAGPNALLKNMYHTRRMFGSGLASAGVAAALAYNGMNGFEERFGAAMSKAMDLFGLINQCDGIRVDMPPEASNIFPLRLDAKVDIPRFLMALRRRSVFLFPDEINAKNYYLTINVTLLRQPNEVIAIAFKDALYEATDRAGAVRQEMV